ncbi:DUF4276 family protein [Tenacibaculum sp. Mcav3-52]|uniref:DUF4276 family protein n=1 Tax=Tenacibaculum sp. Mcav3-52 TaxID=2917762 RepID=UPI001EF1BD30|nr:DUF4276 family protein [Tenacibaculum sp. Mcav3-52]MCG7502759.1 DUF4276 family protein [Tenacibaculum sp. Mcav3-52]
MKRLVFIVEGDTEVIFINGVVIPYLYKLGFKNPMNSQTIITNRKQHKKGGVINYEYLKNDINRVLAQGNVIITTFIDFFRLPTNFPNFTTNSKLIHEIEEGISIDFKSNKNLIPYIQKHELEALMFTKKDGFELIIDEEDKLTLIENIIEEYPNPEDINGNPQNAPSKRLEKIFKYDKVADSEMIFGMLDIQSMIEKCPRFNNWTNSIINKLSE